MAYTVEVSIPVDVTVDETFLDADPTEQDIENMAIEIMATAPSFDHISDEMLERAEAQVVAHDESGD